MRYDPNDPKWTAYVLDELSSEERRQVEQLLAENAQARELVEEIRMASQWLGEELQAEPAPGLQEDRRNRILEKAGQRRKAVFSWQALAAVAATLILAVTLSVYYTTHTDNSMFFTEFETAPSAVPSAPAATGKDESMRGNEAVQPRPVAIEARKAPLPPASEPQRGEGKVEAGGRRGDAIDRLRRQQAVEQALQNASDPQTADQLRFRFASQEAAAQQSQALPLKGRNVQSLADLRSGIAGRTPARDVIIDRPQVRPVPEHNTESYDFIQDNSFLSVAQNPLSTFSIDVDTASYANLRRFLNQGQRPPKDAVRVEEMVNYFQYGYAPPEGEHPFAVRLETASAPWNPEHRLLKVGLKGKEVSADERPAANLVFLIDVSGSMRPANKLPLLIQGMRLLVDELADKDRVAIAVYAGAAGLVLPSTPCTEKEHILSALERLQAGGSTAGAAGIRLAYQTAQQNFIQDGINRVILATDGDFNVGVSSDGELVRLIEEKRQSGVFLSVLGFGMGNYKDSKLEKLADKGNGNYAYIDNLREARKVLVEEMGGTLMTIAKDVKIQIEFNPQQVDAYRLIGYENRLLAAEDFNDDRKDAGEIGAGHTVTALYELVPPGQESGIPGVDPLKYQTRLEATADDALQGELATVKLRYKQPDEDVSRLIEIPLRDSGLDWQHASGDYKFAAGVAAFGMILRDSPHKGSADLDLVSALAESGMGRDPQGRRAEFLSLVKSSRSLMR